MITGTTSNRLSEISRYSTTEPYKVGVNGVTNITYNTNGSVNQIFYTLDSVNYITTIVTDNNNTVTSLPTTFQYFVNNDVTQNINAIKEEAKMGMIFPPKINNQLFIERFSLAIFEKHSRLATIKNIGSLEEYRNGYYNVIKSI
jgi:hypothetical protein